MIVLCFHALAVCAKVGIGKMTIEAVRSCVDYAMWMLDICDPKEDPISCLREKTQNITFTAMLHEIQCFYTFFKALVINSY